MFFKKIGVSLVVIIGMLSILGSQPMPNPTPVLQTIAVTGTLNGTDGLNAALPDVTLSVTHMANPTAPPEARIVYNNAPRLYNLKSLDLAVTASRGLPFKEEFVFMNLSHPYHNYGDNHMWLDDHMGDFSMIRVRKNDFSLPNNTFNSFRPINHRVPGATWLARIGESDPVLPWDLREVNTTGRCVGVTGSLMTLPVGDANVIDAIDCLDMHSLSSMILKRIALATHAAINNITYPFTSISVKNQKLSFIPNLPYGNGMRASIGFVYSVTIVINNGVVESKLYISLPISLVFMPATTGVIIDPITPNYTTNLGRMTVRHDGLVAGFVKNRVRANILAAIPIAAASFPPMLGAGLFLGITASVNPSINRGVNTGNVGRGDYNVLILPDIRSTVTKTVPNTIISLGRITSRTVPVAPAGVVVRVMANGVVTITTGLPDGTGTRVVIPRETVINPVSLYLLGW